MKDVIWSMLYSEGRTLFSLLPLVEHVEVRGIDCAVSDLSFDSRTIRKNSLYVARKGSHVDGHDFIESAIQRGASVVVCEGLPSHIAPDVTFVIVTDSFRALAELSHAWFDFPSRSLLCIGVTGTNGKTTCTIVLKQLLEACGETVGLIGTTGNYIGQRRLETTFTTPEAPQLCALLRQMVDEGVRVVVMEVSSHAIALSRTHGIAFRLAMFTNLSQDHLDFHESMEHYARTKKQLFTDLAAESCAIVNADDEYAAYMIDSSQANRVAVGRSPSELSVSCDECFSITDISHHDAGATFHLGEYLVQSPLIGEFNVENLAQCIVAMFELGYDRHRVIATVPTIQAAPGRMQRVHYSRGIAAIVDYAHTPDALEKTLIAAQSAVRTGGRIFCVMGCGGDRDATKRPIMGAIAEKHADVVIITNDNPRTEDPKLIARDIVAGLRHADSAFVILDRRDAIKHALQLARDGDVVLVAGKGHENYQIIGTERIAFDDVQVIEQCSLALQSHS